MFELGKLTMRKRNRLRPTEPLEARLQKFVAVWREAASTLPAGPDRDELLRKVDQAETTADLREWLLSPELADKIKMKMLSEYLDHAPTFERMAEQETNPVVKAQFQNQADAYRKLAARASAQSTAYHCRACQKNRPRNGANTYALARRRVGDNVGDGRETVRNTA